MKTRWILKLVAPVLMITMVASVAGVFATWSYAEDLPVFKTETLPLTANEFYWEGAENLPEESVVGENHVALIERITKSEYGMNNPSAFLSEYIQDRISQSKDTVSSVAPTPGGNLKDLFNTSEMQKLDFMMHLHLDGNGNIIMCELFTFETADVGNREGKLVSPVYKTVLENKDGQWVPAKTFKGSATSMKYDAKQGGGNRITIDPISWLSDQVVG